MKKALAIVVWIFYPIVLMTLFASILTTNPYMQLSKGLYASHDDIFYDHDYVARELINYLNYRRDDLLFGATPESDEAVMLELEILHMEDVRIVYTFLRVVSLFGLFATIGILRYFYKKDRTMFHYTLRNIFWLPLAIIVFVGTWILIDFNRIFTWFHELFFFFTDNPWTLPYHVLIPLLPEAFWMVSAGLIILGTVIVMALTVWLNHRFTRSTPK